MHDFCFVAAPREFESPKGLLMRMAHHNGFMSVNHMRAYFDLPPLMDTIYLLTRKSPLLQTFLKDDRNLSEPLINFFYADYCLPDSKIQMGGIAIKTPELNRNISYCPVCIQEETLTVFQDLKKLATCPLHNTKIIDHCPSCHKAQLWDSADLIYCSCGYNRKATLGVSHAFIDLPPYTTQRRQQYLKIIDQHYNTALDCEALWLNHGHSTPIKNFTLKRQATDKIQEFMAEQIARYPNFTIAMHIAPWRNLTSQQTCTAALVLLCETFPGPRACPSKNCCADVNWTYAELNASVFEAPYDCKKHSQTRGLYDFYCPCNETIPSNCPCVTVELYRASLHPTTFGPDSHNKDSASIQETAKKLRCSEFQIKQLAESGLVPSMKLQNRRLTIPIGDLEKFQEKYITSGELSNRLTLAPFHVKEVMLLAKAKPVNDAALSWIYPQDEAIQTILNYNSKTLKTNDLEKTIPINTNLALHRRYRAIMMRRHFLHLFPMLEERPPEAREKIFSFLLETYAQGISTHTFSLLEAIYILGTGRKRIISTDTYQVLIEKHPDLGTLELSADDIASIYKDMNPFSSPD